MPVLPTSYPASLPRESFSELPNLDFGSRKKLRASSIYSSCIPACDADSRKSSQYFYSPQRSQVNTYSPVKPQEQARLFPFTSQQSPPAGDSAREAQLQNMPASSFVQTAHVSPDSSDEDNCVSTSEAFFYSDELEDSLPGTEVPSRHLGQVFEPGPPQLILDSIADVLGNTFEDSCKTLAAISVGTFGRISRHKAEKHASSTGTVLVQNFQENAQRLRAEAQMLHQLIRYAPHSILQEGPGRRVQLVSAGPARFITDFDLFTTEEQHASIEVIDNPVHYSSSVRKDNNEVSGTHEAQINTSEPSSSMPATFEYPFNPDAYEIAVADDPKTVDVVTRPNLLAAPPRHKQVNFSKFRRIITTGGTMTEENEAICELTESHNEGQGLKNAALLSGFPDLKDDWHIDDQDFLHIGYHVVGYERSEQDIIRDNATKDAVRFLQIHLAYAYNKLKSIKSLERALDFRHQSHLDATAEVAQLSKDLSDLKAKEAAGKVVFDRMISNMLIDNASKDKELETLRELCNNQPVTKELADLYDALRESRAGKFEYLQHAEESFNLLKRADDRQARAEQEAHTARVGQTFAEMNQQSAEEYHENLKERIVQLESERDQAVEARDLALAEVKQCQHECAADGVEFTEPQTSTTPMGTPSRYHERHDHATTHVDESESGESGLESGGESGAPTEGVTEELEDWDDSEIF